MSEERNLTDELIDRLIDNAETGQYCGSDYLDAARTIKGLLHNINVAHEALLRGDLDLAEEFLE